MVYVIDSRPIRLIAKGTVQIIHLSRLCICIPGHNTGQDKKVLYYFRNGEVYVCGLKKISTKKPDSVEAVKLNTEITQLVWHTDNTKLYIGDNSGYIHVCSILTSKV